MLEHLGSTSPANYLQMSHSLSNLKFAPISRPLYLTPSTATLAVSHLKQTVTRCKLCFVYFYVRLNIVLTLFFLCWTLTSARMACCGQNIVTIWPFYRGTLATFCLFWKAVLRIKTISKWAAWHQAFLLEKSHAGNPARKIRFFFCPPLFPRLDSGCSDFYDPLDSHYLVRKSDPSSSSKPVRHLTWSVFGAAPCGRRLLLANNLNPKRELWATAINLCKEFACAQEQEWNCLTSLSKVVMPTNGNGVFFLIWSSQNPK